MPDRLHRSHQPADPEAAALELIVRVPADVLGHHSPPREVLREFTALLQAEGCFPGMSWHDAKHAATAFIFDAVNRDRRRGVCAVAGGAGARRCDGITWDGADSSGGHWPSR